MFVTADSLGALNVYSATPDQFTDDHRAEGQVFAAQAAIALQAAQTEAQLRSGLTNRTLIGQAQGILMERLKITSDTAFTVLARLSQTHNVKLIEVARRIIDTGDIPR